MSAGDPAASLRRRISSATGVAGRRAIDDVGPAIGIVFGGVRWDPRSGLAEIGGLRRAGCAGVHTSAAGGAGNRNWGRGWRLRHPACRSASDGSGERRRFCRKRNANWPAGASRPPPARAGEVGFFPGSEGWRGGKGFCCRRLNRQNASAARRSAGLGASANGFGDANRHLLRLLPFFASSAGLRHRQLSAFFASSAFASYRRASWRVGPSWRRQYVLASSCAASSAASFFRLQQRWKRFRLGMVSLTSAGLSLAFGLPGFFRQHGRPDGVIGLLGISATRQIPILRSRQHLGGVFWLFRGALVAS